jgi:hypothetical protein
MMLLDSNIPNGVSTMALIWLCKAAAFPSVRAYFNTGGLTASSKSPVVLLLCPGVVLGPKHS